MSNAPHAIKAASQTLADFLASNISGLTVLQEWPAANQQLKYPSVTLTTGTPKRMPLMPYQVGITTPDSKNQVVQTNVVASYDVSFQLDLWTRTKIERDQVLGSIITLFNSEEFQTSGHDQTDGLSLVLEDYFGEYCRYEIDTHEFVDDEASAQRQERRVRIVVLANLREVRQRTYYAMTKIETHTGVAAANPLLDDLEVDLVVS